MSDDLRCNSLTLKVENVSLEALTKESLKRSQIFIEDIMNLTQKNLTMNQKIKTVTVRPRV